MDHGPFHAPLPNLRRNTTCVLTFLLVLISSLLLLDVVDPTKALSALRSHSFFPHNSSSSAPVATTVTRSCDYSYGRWVEDEATPLRSYTEDCAFLDPGFRCHRNGREDLDFRRWRWQPQGCDLPSFDPGKILEMSRNKKIVFAGDSIGRNQWESLVCMLSNGVKNQSTIYEQYGSPITKHKGYLSIKFQDYNLTIDYYRLPFLVVVGRPPRNSSPSVKKSIHVDQLHWISRRWLGADIFVFNAGHWWNQDKTVKMWEFRPIVFTTGFYFQDGKQVNMTMDIKEAFRRTLQTWKQWVLQNLDPKKSRIFFRSYSPTHFRGGSWNEGGRCDYFSGPETNYTELVHEPWNNHILSDTIEEIRNVSEIHVKLLNITYLTEFRKDGHPSVHREPGMQVPSPQDCSHWCLPGIPDIWNELLCADLLLDGLDKNQKS